MNQPTWTDERVKELVGWLEQRQPRPRNPRHSTPTYTDIAERMGLSKGMVIGMAQRLEKGTAIVHPNPEGGTQPVVLRVKVPPRKKPPVIVAESLNPLGKPRQPRLEGTCGYIYGDPKERNWRYCGRKAVRYGQFMTWCDGHLRLVYTPTHKSARKAESA